ncbi:MAG: hypothetical protein Q4G59_12120, partial [Planctomycetia bacterium]|nr:hypothetical protein [Planctomycetia bacterium]
FRVDHVSDAPELKPEGVSAFVDGQVEVDLGSRMIGSLTQLPGEQKPEDAWSKPILFYPNGRTSQAIIQLESSGKYPLYSEIVLRGLTGSARVTAISVYPPGTPEFPGSLPNLPSSQSAQPTLSEMVEQESYAQ